jgi:hypothetical protein
MLIFVENIIDDEEMATKDTNLFFRTVKKMDKGGQGGVVNLLALNNEALAPSQVHRVIQSVNNTGVPHMFSDSNSLANAINDLTTISQGEVSAAAGFQGQIQVMAGDNFAAAAGVEMDLRVAQDIGKDNIVGFQVSVPSPSGVTRRYDVVEKCSSCTLKQRFHENKNWTPPLSGIDDGRLTDMANQFVQDIQIHGPSNFDSMGFNFPDGFQNQDGTIMQALSAKFTDPDVVSYLKSQSIDPVALQATFQSKWSSLANYRLKK